MPPALATTRGKGGTLTLSSRVRLATLHGTPNGHHHNDTRALNEFYVSHCSFTAKTYDEQAKYVHLWVPELRKVPAPHAHTPFQVNMWVGSIACPRFTHV
jgi:hypothetical protein